MFPPDQTAELSTPAGRKPARADVATAAESIAEGRSEYQAPVKVGVWEEGAVIHDRYTLERRLGSGSMGYVFLARDRLLKKHVALKVLRRDMAKSRGTVRRFLREVALAHSVTHPNVVRIYDTGEADGLPYFSMEYLQGQTLDELIEASSSQEDIGDPPMMLREIREISYEILSGLAAAHKAGIVHRDLKPANVMLTHRGAIVMDFGVAGFDAPTPGQRPNPAEARSLVRTEAGTIFGSPAYMAPELWEGAPATVQSDLYSFGVMLYQMLSGRLPIEAPNAKAFLVKLKEEKPPPVRQLRKDTPWNLSLLATRCMNHDPNERPPTAEAAANLVAPLAGRWRWVIAAAVLIALALIVGSFALREPEQRRYRELGVPDAVTEADLDALIRSYDVGDFDAALRQLDRVESRAPSSAAVVFWRATIDHELGDEAARWTHCHLSGYSPEGEGEQWEGSSTWRKLAMAACAGSYSLASPLRALLDPEESSKLPEAWLPLAVTESLIPRLEAARDPGPSLLAEAAHVLRRLDAEQSFYQGPVLATRWQLARFELRLALHRGDEARNLLDDLLTEHRESPLVLARAANFYALVGERDRATQWANEVSTYDPRPSVRLLLDDGRLKAAAAVIDGYALDPGKHPHQQRLVDMWCGYAYRFELDTAPRRCGVVGPGLVHSLWIGARGDAEDQRAMSAIERAIINQQAALNANECLARDANHSVITGVLPPFETYLRQLEIYSALCRGGRSDLDAARRLADELIAATAGDPWAQLIDAQVDEAREDDGSAAEKRRAVVERWRDADDDLPLVQNVRALLDEDEPGEDDPR